MDERQGFFRLLNSYFDNIYVITLERATDRQDHIRKELNGLRYSFFFGKDKQQFSAEQLQAQGVYNEEKARQNHRYGKAMHTGQIGVAWSHAEVYRDMLEHNYQRVLILEDDVVIGKNAAGIFEAAVKELPAGWDLVYLGFEQREKAPRGLFFKKLFYHFLRFFGAIRFSHATISHLYPQKISEHIYRAGYHDCSHAYALTQAAAQKLLSLQQPISFIADNLLAFAATGGLLNGYIVLPRIINQQYQVGEISTSYNED